MVLAVTETKDQPNTDLLGQDKNGYLIQESADRTFSVYCHFLVTKGNYIYMASLFGVETAVRAIFSGMVMGRDEELNGKRYESLGGHYRRLDERTGEGTHALILHKDAYFQEWTREDNNNPSTILTPFIVAPDGDIKKAISMFMIHRFSLPSIWWEHYYSLIQQGEIDDEYNVWVNPDSPIWPQLKVIRLKISEESIIKRVDKALKAGILRMDKNQVLVKGVFREGMTMKDYLQENALNLAEKLADKEPYHDPSKQLNWGFRTMSRTPFPIQAHAIQAVVNAFEDGHDTCILNGDMGSGKSIQALGVIHMMYTKQLAKGKNSLLALLVAPSITVPKWQNKEIKETLPYAKVRIIECTADAIALYHQVKAGYRPEGLEIILCGTDRTKFGPEPWFAGVYKRIRGTKDKHAFHCPDCGNILMHGKKDEELPLEWDDIVQMSAVPSEEDLKKRKTPSGIPEGTSLKWGKKVVDKCTHPVMVREGVPLRDKVGNPVMQTITTHLRDEKTGELLYDEKQNPIMDERELPVFKEYKLVPKKDENGEIITCAAKLWRPARKLDTVDPHKKKSKKHPHQHKKNRVVFPNLVQLHESRMKPRFFISRILKRMGKAFDILAWDEVHQVAAESSGRGDAFGQVVLSAKKRLLLTGTIVNGKSSSIKSILWRTNPKALIDDGFNYKTSSVAFAQRYGSVKEIIDTEERDDGVITRQKKGGSTVTEEPGIAPALTANHLLGKTIFLGLEDLGLPLVSITERCEFIDLDNDHRRNYLVFHEGLYDACAKASMLGAKGVWSKFIPATINYASNPSLGASVTIGDHTYTADALPETYFTAMERRLVEIVKSRLEQGRGVTIFNRYTQGYQMNERTQYVLNAHGIQCRIMKNIGTDERVEWLMKAEEDGVKVIVTNMKLVEVGLDMQPWQTIIFNQIDYDINMIRQASRRHWRIGQILSCETIFMIANGTQQMAQFYNIMEKRAQAMLVEGRLDKSDLSKFSNDSRRGTAADLAACLADSSLADKWQELASKDIDKNLEIIESDNFKEILKERMIALGQETLSVAAECPDWVEASWFEAQIPKKTTILQTPMFKPTATTVSLEEFEQGLDSLFDFFDRPEPIPVESAEKPPLDTHQPVTQVEVIDFFDLFHSEQEFVPETKVKSSSQPRRNTPSSKVAVNSLEDVGQIQLNLFVETDTEKLVKMAGKSKKLRNAAEAGQLAFDLFA